MLNNTILFFLSYKKQLCIVYIFHILFFSWKTIHCIIKKLSQNLWIIIIKINDKYTQYIKIKVFNRIFQYKVLNILEIRNKIFHQISYIYKNSLTKYIVFKWIRELNFSYIYMRPEVITFELMIYILKNL
jgi:hypothetical protein